MGPTKADFDRVFEEERQRIYPQVDEYERQTGYAMDRGRLESMARTLECPLKRSPPNWQHGRVLYSSAREWLQSHPSEFPGLFLDVGTAKGFSALCMAWALRDHGILGAVHSVDVIGPSECVPRNSVAELDGLLTLHDFVEPHLPTDGIVTLTWFGGGSDEYFKTGRERICFAFVDGKHTRAQVERDAANIAARQVRGDMIVFDDVNIPGVWDGVKTLRGYGFDKLVVSTERTYCIATKMD